MKIGQENIKEKYQKALENFVQKVKKDNNIIAAFSYGSIVKDNLWEKSDIDIWLISKENSKKVYNQYSLVEEDIDFQVELYSRNYFIELLDNPASQNLFRTVLKQSNLLFSNDETIEGLFNNDICLGDRDKEENLLKASMYSVICIKKAEKYIKVEENLIFCFNVLLKLIRNIACIEAAMNNEFQSREVELQALRLNYDFFNKVYVDLINTNPDRINLKNKIDMCKKYLDDKTEIVFEPIIKYLREEGEVRGVSELNEYIKRKYHISNDGNELTDTYNFLVEKNILIKTSASIKLLDKSKVFLEEAAYSYDFDYHV